MLVISLQDDGRPVQYGYRVASLDTGNFQQRKEQRDGKTVEGSYQASICFYFLNIKVAFHLKVILRLGSID